MHVLNVADGKQPVAPVLIDRLDFNNVMRKTRSSAALIAPGGVKTILECTGSTLETTNGSYLLVCAVPRGNANGGRVQGAHRHL